VPDNPELKLEIILDNGSVQRAFARVTSESNKAGAKSGNGFKKGFEGGFSALNLTGATLAANAISNITSEIRQMASESITAYRSFSRGVAEVNSILPDNAKLTDASRESLLSYSQLYATSGQQQAKAYYNIVSAGVRGTAKQLSVLQQANQASIAGLTDIDVSAKALVSTMNAYSLSGVTAKEVSDILFVTVREGQTTFSELSASLGRVSPLAASAGLELSELAGFVGFLTKAGIETTEAITGVRGILTAIVKPSVEAAANAKKIGLEFNAASLKSKGLAAFLRDVTKATGGSSTELAKLFPRVQALTPILQATGGRFSDLTRILNETSKAAGSTKKAFDEISKNADFQARLVESSYNRVLNKIGRDLSDFALIAKSAISSAFSTSATDATRDILRLNDRISNLQEQLRSNNGSTSFLEGIFGKGEEEARLKRVSREITRLTEKRSQLQAVLSSTQPSFGPEAPDPDAQAARRAQIAADLLSIRSAQGEYEKLVESTRAVNLSDFWANFTQGFNQSFKDVNIEDKKKQIEEFKKQIVSFGKQTRKALIGGFAASVGNAFSAFGAALVNGENALSAFLDAFLAAIGQQLVQQGTAFILQGIAISANPYTAGAGVPLIAAGAAMATFGGVLSAVTGGGAPSNGSNGSSDFGSSNLGDDSLDLEGDLEERAEAETKVSINIQGDVLDSDETGLRIAKILEEASLNNNIKIIGVAA
jgi:TP901 family phage tail tape measure protein